MTINDALMRVVKIEYIKKDDEAAHSEEDKFRNEILQHIAEGGEDAKELARIALETNHIQFARWCA